MADINQKNHHYLSKGILRAFGSGKKNQQVFFINKITGLPAERTNVKNVACINRFYNFESKNDSLEVDYFGVIDRSASNIVKSLLQISDISEFDRKQIEKLALFVAAQLCRVPQVFESLNAINKAFTEQISGGVKVFDGGTKDFFLEQIKANSELYKTILLKKKMTVVRTKIKTFVIGDNPVVVLKHNNRIITSGEHTAAADAEIFMMPISPTDMLVFFDEWNKGEIYSHALNNNNMQFWNSTEYVFGYDKESLENGLKQYYDDVYEYIEVINPDFIKENNIIKGDPIAMGQTQFSFEGNAINSLRTMGKNL